MLPLEMATRLREAGLAWTPAPGDRFALPDRGIDEVFVLSNMTIQVYELPKGPVIGFNGTTEWALDDIEKEEAVWIPREDQLRDRLGATFRGLDRVGDAYRVVTVLDGATGGGGGRAGELTEHLADSAEEAYAMALLHRLGALSGA